jgi:hypothetical protein
LRAKGYGYLIDNEPKDEPWIYPKINFALFVSK